MKWIIILVLCAVVFLLIFSRYRKHIQTGLYVFRMFRQMRQANKSDPKQIEKPNIADDSTLVNCAKCGAWVPQNKALKLRSGAFYCSTQCLETAARVA